jgi:hypothetical protein
MMSLSRHQLPDNPQARWMLGDVTEQAVPAMADDEKAVEHPILGCRSSILVRMEASSHRRHA